MKELDKTKRYNISKLNDEQLTEVLHWLEKNDGWDGWDLRGFKEDIDEYSLYYHENIKKWYFNTDMSNSTCATELFTDHIPEVEKKVEQVNLNLESNPINGNIFSGLIDMQPIIKKNNFKEIGSSIVDLLEYKNSQYGNSALEPLDVFNNKCKVGQRLDDKLARIKNAEELRKNDVCDLIGYLFLTCQENEWFNFDEFKD